jgi:hypothetical protein
MDVELRTSSGVEGKNPDGGDPSGGKTPRVMHSTFLDATRVLQEHEKTNVRLQLDPRDFAETAPSPVSLAEDEKAGDVDEGPIAPNCPGAISLSSRNVTSLLALLESAPIQWPTGSLSPSSEAGSDAVTTVTSNLTGADFLERRSYSPVSLLNEDIPTKVKDVKSNIGQTLAELMNLKRELEIVSRERDLLKERESQHTESLKILKQELNTLTLAKVTSPADFSSELEQLRIENELFAAQIVESEVEMREIRTLLECLDAENSQMRKDLEAVRGKVSEDKLCQKRLEPESMCENWSLVSQVETLKARLLDLERSSESMNQTLEEERRLRKQETDWLKVLIDQTRTVTESAFATQLSSCEGIEVTMGDLVNDVEDSQKEPTAAKETERGDLLGMCDCCLFAKNDE